MDQTSISLPVPQAQPSFQHQHHHVNHHHQQQHHQQHHQQQQQQQRQQQQQQQQQQQIQSQQHQQQSPQSSGSEGAPSIDIAKIIKECDNLFPQVSFTARSNYIKKLEHFVMVSFARHSDPLYNVVYLQRNCGDSANPYIQFFILELFGDFITTDNCIFSIPTATAAALSKAEYLTQSQGPQHTQSAIVTATVSKPFMFYTNIFPALMVRFLTKRPELITVTCPGSGQTILHQYALDFTVLKLAYHANSNLVTVRDKQNRLPLHHKNLPQYIVAAALREFPELAKAADARGNTCQQILGLS